MYTKTTISFVLCVLKMSTNCQSSIILNSVMSDLGYHEAFLVIFNSNMMTVQLEYIYNCLSVLLQSSQLAMATDAVLTPAL